MRQTSLKRQRENRIRRRVIEVLAAERGLFCEVPWCWRPFDDAHEVLSRARGGSITDPANIRLVCRIHHEDLTNEAAWGYECGFLRHSWEAAS